MAVAFGRDATAVAMIRRQTDFLTPATGRFVLLPGYSRTGASRRLVEADQLLGQGDTFDEGLLGFEEWSGDWEAPLRAQSIGWHLRQLLGDPVTTGTGPWTHIFTPLPPTFATIGRGAGDLHFRDIGVAWNTMRMQIARGSLTQRVIFGLIGQRETRETAVIDATPLIHDQAQDVRFFAFDGSVSLDGGTINANDLVSLEMTLSRGLAADTQAQSGTPSVAALLQQETMSLTGAATFRLDGAARYDAARAGTQFSLRVGWTSGAASLTIDVDRAMFSSEGVRLPGPGAVELSMPWRGSRPRDPAAPIVATLVNDVPSYGDPT